MLTSREVQFHAEQIADATRDVLKHVQILIDDAVGDRSRPTQGQPVGRLRAYQDGRARTLAGAEIVAPAGAGGARAVIHDGPAKRRRRTKAVTGYALRRSKLWTGESPSKAKLGMLTMLNPSVGKVHGHILKHKGQTKKDIAKALGLATHTVENSLYQLRKAGLARAEEQGEAP